MIFKPIKSFDDAADYFSREDNDFYDKCRKTFSKSLLEATEKEAVKKAKKLIAGIQKNDGSFSSGHKNITDPFITNHSQAHNNSANHLRFALTKEEAKGIDFEKLFQTDKLDKIDFWSK